MGVTDLLTRLAHAGRTIERHGDRLRIVPALASDLLTEVSRNKPELLRVLRDLDASPPCNELFCCWCRAEELIETPAGLRCQACGAMAWWLIEQATGWHWRRADYPDSALPIGRSRGD